ncbi:Card1-like endonuclease domain-containing protein [Thiomicrorhabdus lithotrophica]|uniref:DUF1887 family CARF protein n=1 Tax=Thiomicrorhabdus lithotrophica TaxID=2949997 RepID=A0ABY8CCB0_9GAMM|nr:DUF1887 family CARF protein [Thiomicrorhabdus lithotrophica]WEJ63605.1 DUF1887 family CARF protein [Thiomicrorhabdus lithotrophica]
MTSELLQNSNQFSTHLVFADREMTPNLAPILDKRLTVKKVIILYTLNLADNASRLKKIYHSHDIESVLTEIEPEFEINQIVESFTHILKEMNLETVAINLSCANKMNTLGAFKAFENTPVGLYYLLPNDQLKWIQPPGLEEFSIAENILLEEFLHAHGIDYSHPVTLSPSQANFANGLVNAIEKIILQQNALTTYQHFSTRHARGKSIKIIKHENKCYLNDIHNRSHLKADLLLGLFRKLHNQNILNLKENAQEASPQIEKDPWRRTFFEGGWLEYYAYRAILEIKTEEAKIKDVAFGVKLERQNAFDEADVLFIANNQLFLVECKTGANANINLHLQRLDSLKKRLGGVSSHALLITTEIIGDNVHKANLLNIGVIDGSQLSNLKHYLKEWISKEIHTKEK